LVNVFHYISNLFFNLFILQTGSGSYSPEPVSIID